jgi:hypothetical protein
LSTEADANTSAARGRAPYLLLPESYEVLQSK